MKLTALAITTINWQKLDVLASEQERPAVTSQLNVNSIRIEDPLSVIRGLAYFLDISQVQAQTLCRLAICIETDQPENVKSIGLRFFAYQNYYFFEASIAEWLKACIQLSGSKKKATRLVGNKIVAFLKNTGLREFLNIPTVDKKDGTFSFEV